MAAISKTEVVVVVTVLWAIGSVTLVYSTPPAWGTVMWITQMITLIWVGLIATVVGDK